MENTRGSEWNRWDLHLHTASSYDAKYKGNDADQLLCAALKEKHIKAVAITDHFVIDKDRIEHLRSIAPDIVFFPGVELRTDKNANNLHIILIFDCESRLSELAEDFNAIMYRQKAKAKEADETIYWDFNDIVEFANEHDALISIHAGRKVNGIDKELPNSKALPHQFAAKDEIGKKIHFFEVGQKRDIDDYKKYIWPSVGKKPIIICSDCHDPREYEQKAPLWIKSKFTFDGLKQCLYQPEERVFVGDIPPALDRICKNKQVNIDTIAVHRKTDCVHKDMKCFDFQIPLNAGLVSIIGNKGSAEDSVGANDNGSGVAAVLELARILKDTEMPYNVKFILFSGEEKYMLGSRWYVGNLSEDERKQIIGVINIDTIAEKSDLGYMAMIEGNKRPDDIEYDDEGLKKLAELNKNSMSDLFTSSDRFYLTMATNSDHYPFALVDIPAVSIVQDWQDGLNVNDSSDVKENMDMQRIVEVIEKVTEVLSEIPSNN